MKKEPTHDSGDSIETCTGYCGEGATLSLPNVADKQVEGLEHVNYEYTMLRDALSGIRLFNSMDIVRNAFVESFAIHSRVLIEFLHPNPAGRKDDIIAAAFVRDEESWIKERGAKPDVLAKAKVRADKMVGHLTYARLSLDRQWPAPQIVSEIDRTWRLFLSHCRDEFKPSSPRQQQFL